MYRLELRFGDGFVPCGLYQSRDDAHWAAAGWRQRYGRPTNDADPFRVVEVVSTPTIADRLRRAEASEADTAVIAAVPMPALAGARQADPKDPTDRDYTVDPADIPF